MDKKLSYLENVLFLLFCKLESKPQEAGKAVGVCIREALQSVFPTGKYSIGTKALKISWFTAFVRALLNELKETKNIINE
jgi:hypothetical protein